jgi:23S rRNA pseudouridine2605 synthase
LFEKLPAGLPRVISIGRLDFNSEGLLLLTNDGALARRLELPATGWLRRYRVRVHGEFDEARLPGLEKGIAIDGVRYGAIQAVLDSRKGSNAWLTLSLREGKNREVRRIVEALGGVVTRLIRIAYGPFQLGYLEPGAVEEVPARVMRDQLGSGDGKSSGSADRRRLRNRAPDPAPDRAHRRR